LELGERQGTDYSDIIWVKTGEILYTAPFFDRKSRYNGIKEDPAAKLRREI